METEKMTVQKSEIDKLLAMAEDYQNQYENMIQQLEVANTYYGGSLAVAPTTALCMLLIVYRIPFSTGALVGVCVFFLLLIASIWVFFRTERVTRRLKGKMRAGKVSLERLLGLIPEAVGFVAEHEGWSVLERAEYEIRLARLGITDWTGSKTGDAVLKDSVLLTETRTPSASREPNAPTIFHDEVKHGTAAP